MRRFLKNTNLLLFGILTICFVLFLPGFSTYFHQDDFIHFSYSQNVHQVISAFDIFHKGEFPFYRPIPTQLYFFLGSILFGYNPLGYHVANFLIFSLNIFLVFRLVKLISKKEVLAVISAVFFAINSTHFAPLYSAAYVHELLYVLFGVLTVDNFVRWMIDKQKKNYFISVLFFVLSLMTKETAVILPGIIALAYIFIGKRGKLAVLFKVLFPYASILGIYLFGHLIYYGIASGPSYTFMLGKSTFNILAWYFLWALSTPNILIDFIGPGLRISPVFLQVTQYQGLIYFVLFPLLVILGLVLLVKLVKLATRSRNWQKLKLPLFGSCWFVTGMVPLVIFPLHKLATEQAFSLVGLSLGLAFLLDVFVYSRSKYRILAFAFIAVYFVIAVNSILLGRRAHWIVRSAQQAKSVIDFMKAGYPNLADNAAIYFKNGEVKISQYGSSRQIYQALGNGVGLKLILNKPNIRLYFEDLGQIPKVGEAKNMIQIDSSQLLGY